MRKEAPRYLVKDPVLTEAEAARGLRVSITTVRNERRDGRFSYIKIPGRVFISLSELRAYADRSLVMREPPPMKRQQESLDVRAAMVRTREMAQGANAVTSAKGDAAGVERL